jgi:hypothetical protein
MLLSKAKKQFTGIKTRSLTCSPEANGGKSCAELLDLPHLEPEAEALINSSKICAGNEEVAIICPEDFEWYLLTDLRCSETRF